MDEELADELLDDMEFVGNRVKCWKIEGMLPELMKMVEGGERSMSYTRWENQRAQVNLKKETKERFRVNDFGFIII